MRRHARYTGGGCGTAAFPAPGGYTADEPYGSSAEHPGPDAKVDLAGLIPGGMTQGPEPGVARFLHTSSPEPVIGYGGTKGILAYYQAVLYFGNNAKDQKKTRK
jgi:hypothetical protein